KVAAANFFYTMEKEEFENGPSGSTVKFGKAMYFKTSSKMGYVIYKRPEQPGALSLVE
ncbi:3114_t:CDS:2, partial [Dentiscutata erythropus]